MTIEIDGMKQLRQELNQAILELQNRGPDRDLQDAMQRSMMLISTEMADYPRQDPTSTYRRTGTLGRRWIARSSRRISTDGDSIRGTVGNNTKYAPFVQSHAFQAAVHRRNRWPTDVQVLRDNTSKIVRIFARVIDGLFRG